MGSRWCLFGYEMKNNQFIVVEFEANIVKLIFDKYLSGFSLKMIADILSEDRITYHKEKNIWNKNMVSRIIENKHYVGDENYPRIIDVDIYDQAEKIRKSKGQKREKDSKEMQFLKSHSYCSECGSRYRRVNKQSDKERWFCSNKCKSFKNLDDNMLMDSIINVINNLIENPYQLTYPTKEENSVESSMSVIKQENELGYLLDQGSREFKELSKKVFSIMYEKYECCKEDLTGFYTQAFIEHLETLNYIDELDYELLFLIVKKIVITTNGKISITVANDKTFSIVEGEVQNVA